MIWTANEGPITGAKYSKALQLGGLVAAVVMITAFYIVYLPDAEVRECASAEGGMVGVIAIAISAFFGVAIGLYVAAMAALRLSGKASMAYKARSFLVGWNHSTHAAAYVLCGLAQTLYVAVAVTFAASILTSDSTHCSSGANRLHAVLMLVSAVCLAPFIAYKLFAVRRCPAAGWSSTQQTWSAKFGADAKTPKVTPIADSTAAASAGAAAAEATTGTAADKATATVTYATAE